MSIIIISSRSYLADMFTFWVSKYLDNKGHGTGITKQSFCGGAMVDVPRSNP